MANEPLGGDEYIARDYVWGVNHPIDVMGDLRKWQRAASGGAPPTQNDADSKIRVVVSDNEGNEEVRSSEERSEELGIRQLQSYFVYASSYSNS